MHPTTEEFHRLLDKMREIHKKKSHDYAGTEDPLSTFKLTEQLSGIPAWHTVYNRVVEKLARIGNFIKSETLEVADEKIEDTFLDLAIHALNCRILYLKTIPDPSTDEGIANLIKSGKGYLAPCLK